MDPKFSGFFRRCAYFSGFKRFSKNGQKVNEMAKTEATVTSGVLLSSLDLVLFHMPVFKRPPADAAPQRFFEMLKKSDFSKIGQTRLWDRFWADLGLKFGFCVNNCIGTSVQNSISSFFENLFFYKSGFWLFFHF